MDTLYGPTLNPGQFRPPFDDVVEELVRKGHELHELLRVHMKAQCKHRSLEIRFVDKPALNACATINAGADFIYIFRGTVETVYGNILGLLSIPAFLPAVGDITREIAPESPLPGGFPPVPLLRNAAKSEERLFFPKEQVRINAAEVLSQLAFEFLLYHEIGHIWGGHLELFQANLGSSTVSELAQAATDSDAWKLQHVLECDADAFACHVTAWVHTQSTVAESLCGGMNWPEPRSRHLALLTYLTAIGVLFRLLYRDAPLGPDCKSSHPHPAVRACLVAAATMARGVHDGRFTPSVLDHVVADSIGDLEALWTDLCLPGQNLESADAWGQSVRNAAMELFECYGNTKSLLDQYARIPRRWDDWQWPARDVGGP